MAITAIGQGFIKLASSEQFPEETTFSADQHYLKRLKTRFGRITDALNHKGVYAGTYHKRLLIPKNILTEDDIHGLGFMPVTVAIPEAGQDRLRSFRHPDNLYHIHSHPEGWTIHKDEYPAATMLMISQKHLLNKAKSLVKGVPHIFTEGIPGLAVYLKNKIRGGASMSKAVHNEQDKRLSYNIKRWTPSITWRPQISYTKN